MELQEAYSVLNDMMKSFEEWFPVEDLEDEESIELYKERFASTKLCLELGEYTREDYEYLFHIRRLVLENEIYYEAIEVFIIALSGEYGWI